MFTLPQLPYEYDALEPYIRRDIQQLHHTGHHAAYIKNLNTALEKYPDLANKTIEELVMSWENLPEDIKKVVRNNGGGHYNHSMFWQMMRPKSDSPPSGTLLAQIKQYFGDLTIFQTQFSEQAIKVFGSGWQWLVLDGEKLSLMSTPNQDSPLTTGKIPLLGLDLWEHAYYLQYYNKRPDYVSAWWNVVNWEDVALRLDLAKK